MDTKKFFAYFIIIALVSGSILLSATTSASQAEDMYKFKIDSANTQNTQQYKSSSAYA